VTESLKALSAVPSQLSSSATVLSIVTWQVWQSTVAVSLHDEVAWSHAFSAVFAQVALVIFAVSVPSTAVHTQVPPEQLPTAAVVG